MARFADLCPLSIPRSQFQLIPLRKLRHERAQNVVIHVLPLCEPLLRRIGVQAPNFALVHTELKQLVRAVVQRKVKSVEKDAVRLPLNGSDEFGIPLRGEAGPDVLHGPKDIDAGRRGLHRSAADLNVFLRVHEVLPLEVVRAHLAIDCLESERRVARMKQ